MATSAPTVEVPAAACLLLKKSAMCYKTMSGLSHFDDEIFDNKFIHQTGQGQLDDKGKDVGGYYVVCDGGEVMLFPSPEMARAWARNKLYVNVVLAPSLSYVDIGHEKLAVVNEADLVKLILRYPRMPALRFAAAAPAPPVALPVPDAAGASSSAPGDGPPVARAVLGAPSPSLALPAGRWDVTSSIAALYGMKMRDVDLGRFSVQSDAVVRFRSSDDKVAVTDILVGVGEHDTFEDAQEAMWTLIEHDDVKIRDLDSLEVVLDEKQKVCAFCKRLNVLVYSCK